MNHSTLPRRSFLAVLAGLPCLGWMGLGGASTSTWTGTTAKLLVVSPGSRDRMNLMCTSGTLAFWDCPGEDGYDGTP